MAHWRQVLVRRPWWHSPVLWIAIVVAFALSGTLTANFTVWNKPAVPSLPSFQRETNQPAPSTSSGQAPTVAPVIAPKIVDYQVVWTEVRGFNPFTIPVEEGFYNGFMPNEVSWSPSDPSSVPKRDVFSWKILPHLTEIGRGSQVAAVRDQNNKDIVLVSILPVATYPPYVLLSVNGEKSWCMLNLLPIWARGYQQGDVHDLRVVAKGEEIHLYGQHALGPRNDLYWWEATVKKSELPCS